MAINPLISTTYCNHFIRYSSENGIDVSEAIKQLNIGEKQDFILFNDFKTILAAISKQANKPWIGFEYASKLQISSHGSLGFAVTHGNDLSECLELISRYYQTRLQAMDIRLAIDGKSCQLQVIEACDWKPVSIILYETILLTLVNVIEYIIGIKIQQCSINLPYSSPQWNDKYSEFLPCPFSFGHNKASITIPVELLKHPCISSNQRTSELAKNQCDVELADLSKYETLTLRIGYLIERYQFTDLTVEKVASHLNMSKSTLTRKLKVEDTTYKEILENLKKQHSVSLLLNSNDTVESIAYKLGYEDNSNFSRSFKRWFGCTPTAYREKYSFESK